VSLQVRDIGGELLLSLEEKGGTCGTVFCWLNMVCFASKPEILDGEKCRVNITKGGS